MADAFAIARIGLLADLERLNIASQNISGSSISGYRRQIGQASDFASVSNAALGHAGGYSGIRLTQTQSDLTPGTFKSTGRSLDIALEGPGFLTVQTPDGIRYTRRGDLHLDVTGRLQTSMGHSVLAKGGEIFLSPREAITIDKQGTVRQGDRTSAHLEIVEFSNPSELVYEGESLFQASDSADIVSANRTFLQQGVLENSNVVATQEMIDLLQISRHFELTRHALTAYDNMLDTAVNRLGQS